MKISEIANTIKPLTPQQSRIATLKNNVKRAQDVLQAEKKKQKITIATNKLQKAISTKL